MINGKLIVLKPGLTIIILKVTPDHRRLTFKGLRALQEISGKRFQRGVVFYTGTEIVAFGANLYAFPIASLWRPWLDVGKA